MQRQVNRGVAVWGVRVPSSTRMMSISKISTLVLMCVLQGQNGFDTGGMHTYAAPAMYGMETRPETYVITLTVRDPSGAVGMDSKTVSTTNAVPVVDAGLDISLIAPATVYVPCHVLPCTQSQRNFSYDPDGDAPLYYTWYVTRPDGSTWNQILGWLPNGGTSLAIPTDKGDGDYHVTLEVVDIFNAIGRAQMVISLKTNTPPVASAGTHQSVFVGDTVHLDGSGSTDPNGDPLTYQWAFTSLPAGSRATLIGSGVSQTFVADLAGTYVVSLTVNDGLVDSQPSTVTIAAISRVDGATAELQQTMGLINGLSSSVFTNPNMRNTLTNKINAVLQDTEGGLYQDARDKLTNDLLAKVDGCKQSGAPDKNDSIRVCTNQAQVYRLISEAISSLSNL